jgi:2-haloacid dehalogenase
MAPAVAILDVNETLSDLGRLGARFEEVGAPSHLLAAWFAGTLRDGISLAASGGFAEFGDVAHSVLRTQLADVEGLGRQLDDAVAHILEGMATLPVHPDVKPGLRLLRENGVRVATLTNGSAANTEALLARAGLEEFVERNLDVRAAGRWKPAPEPYRHACRSLGVAESKAAMIAVHPWDIHGAKRAGLLGAWLDRGGRRYPDVFAAPDFRGRDFHSVAVALLR